jgi:hypothetical protein
VASGPQDEPRIRSSREARPWRRDYAARVDRNLNAAFGWPLTSWLLLLVNVPSLGSARDVLLTRSLGQLIPVGSNIARIATATATDRDRADRDLLVTTARTGRLLTLRER